MSGKRVQLHTLKIEIAHGSDRHEISLFGYVPPTVGELLKELEKRTRVPISYIQLLFKGQKLHYSPEKALTTFGIFSGSRLLMVGERMNANQDAVFRRVLGIGKDVELVIKSLNEALNEFSLIENGGIDRSMSKDYVPQLHKRAHGMKRDLEAFLSVLGDIDVNKYELPEDVKKHQINITNYIKEHVQKCDSLINKLSKIN